MKNKVIELFLCIALIIAVTQGKAIAQEATTNQNVSPPPVRTTHVQKGVLNSSTTGMYIGMESGGMDLKMYGIVSEASEGITENLGFSMSGMALYGGASGEMDMKMGGGSFGANLLYEFIEGEKRNAVGEITKIKSGLTGFAGAMVMLMGMGSEMTINSETWKMSIMMMSYQLHAGLIGELALHRRLQLVPYAYVGTMGGTMSMSMGNGDYMSSSESIPSSSVTSYGGDIIIRPSATNPKWKISLGTLFQQIAANTGGATFIMLGINYEAGAHYSETVFGPVLN